MGFAYFMELTMEIGRSGESRGYLIGNSSLQSFDQDCHAEEVLLCNLSSPSSGDRFPRRLRPFLSMMPGIWAAGRSVIRSSDAKFRSGLPPPATRTAGVPSLGEPEYRALVSPSGPTR